MLVILKQLDTTINNIIHVGRGAAADATEQLDTTGWSLRVRWKGGFASAAVATDVRLYGLKDIKGLKGLAASAAVGLYLDATKYNLALKHLSCFCPYRAHVPAIANPGRCPGLLAYWPFRPS